MWCWNLTSLKPFLKLEYHRELEFTFNVGKFKLPVREESPQPFCSSVYAKLKIEVFVLGGGGIDYQK